MKIERGTADRWAPFPVAVVGIHGRFPGAGDVRTFWDNLCEGRDPITRVPEDRWNAEAIFGEPDDVQERTYANTGGFAPHVDCFDCGFFNILPREAESMDPQQRLFLQTAWAALEDAGCPPRSLAGKPVGVFVGVGHADYPVLMRQDKAPFDVFRGTGIVPTAIPNRVSFTLDLRGPSEAIDTACSGSLVAIHRAVQALAFDECELAIAGGVNLLLGPELFIAFAKAGMLSRTGRCRPFDAAGDGYVRGEGVAALVLRPLRVAEANGDFIYGVIRGSAENHGGRTHSFTAPSVSAQADVIQRAWSRAGLSIQDASIIETHGTGTHLGDPIEIKGLKEAFKGEKCRIERRGEGKSSVALGALKSHVGHLEAAAGVASVVKALLSMQHRVVPPNLHYKDMNPEISLDETPFYIPARPVHLTDHPDETLLAGVSSFGFGGSNAHVALEGYRGVPEMTSDVERESECPYLIPISAQTAQGLQDRVRQLIDYLEAGEEAQFSGQRNDRICQVGEALDLGRLPKDCGQLKLSALGVTVDQLVIALKRVSGAERCAIGIKDIRDCVTLQDLADKITEVSRSGAVRRVENEHSHLSRVALPADILQRVTLAEISYSLMHGRDAMAERLAIVANSKQSLLADLSGFLADPNNPEAGWLHGSVRANRGDCAAEPANRDSAPSADALKEWARYWLSSRKATLHWSVLHSAAPPKKVPLPAYPFQLKRVWYSARPQGVPERPPGDSIAAQKPVRDAPRAQHPPALRWVPCAAGSPVAFPSSAVGLAYLLEQLGAKIVDRAVCLTQVEFGRPRALDEERFTCRTRGDDTTAIVQCLYAAGKVPHVLVQGRVSRGSAKDSTGRTSPRSEARPLKASAFYAEAERAGVSVAAEFRCAHGVTVAREALFIDTALSRRASDDASFWCSLFATTLAGAACLSGHTSPRLGAPTPFRAARVVFDPRAGGSVAKIVIEKEDDGEAFHIRALGADGDVALVFRGLELRQSVNKALQNAVSVSRYEEARAS